MLSKSPAGLRCVMRRQQQRFAISDMTYIVTRVREDLDRQWLLILAVLYGCCTRCSRYARVLRIAWNSKFKPRRNRRREDTALLVLLFAAQGGDVQDEG